MFLINIIRCVAVLLFLAFFSLPCAAQVPDVGSTHCLDCSSGTCVPTPCDGNGGGGAPPPPIYPSPVPSGPSAEELRQQKEKKDLQGAALDDNDAGYEAYERKDYAKAVELFKQALDEDPDNEEITHNLQKAQEALNYSALSQIKSVDYHSQSAVGESNEAAHAHAQMGFDTSGLNKSTVQAPAVSTAHEVYSDPVVPPEKLTIPIRFLQWQRDGARKEIAQLEEERKKLDPQKDAVEIAKIKQKQDSDQKKIYHFNFSITEELRKASAPNAKPQ